MKVKHDLLWSDIMTFFPFAGKKEMLVYFHGIFVVLTSASLVFVLTVENLVQVPGTPVQQENDAWDFILFVCLLGF